MTPEELVELAKRLVVEYLREPPEYSYVYEDPDIIDMSLSDEDQMYIHDYMTEVLDEMADQIEFN